VIAAPITGHLSKFVRALAVSGKGSSLEAYASAVPAVYEGRPMLLTAKHVLDQLEGRRLYLEIPGHFQPLILSSAAIIEHPQADAAVILLPEGAFEWKIDFLHLDIQFEPPINEGEVEIFIAMGFPWRETTIDYKARTLGLKIVNYWSFENMEGYKLLRLPSHVFLTTGFDIKNAIQAQDGRMKEMKRPEGMSGGAVWRLWGPGTEYPSLQRGALAGIICEYHRTPTKCLVSVRVGVFQALAAELVTRTA
jgi:hypothetical protein